MRRDFWLGLIGVAVLAGCEKPKVQSADEAPATEASTTQETQATPSPATAQATPGSIPTAPEAAGGPKVDDEVYLVRRFSIPIDGGMRGFREGSKVKVVSIEGSKLTVSGNDVQFDVQSADISVTPPVVQSTPPSAAAPTTATSGSSKPTAPGGRAPLSEIEKKKQANIITAELSNLQLTLNKTNASISQLTAKTKQIQTQLYSGSRSQNSPEARARIAEIDRLEAIIRKQTSDIYQLQRAITLKERELMQLK